MSRTVVRITVLLSAFVLVAFVVFLVNQTAQLVHLAGQVHPTLGSVVLYGLLTLYGVLLLVPALLYLRLPKQPSPPASTNAPEFPAFLAALQRRLASNPRLDGQTLNSLSDTELAIRKLDEEANRVARKAAAAVFLTTAVSQSGRLDTLMVLSAQSKMVWEIAHIYYQRPSARDFVRLYGNVAATSFLAAEIDDLDMEPVTASLFGSVLAGVPGTQLIAGSVLSGAANAFLTLRVAMVAKRYCNCLVQRERRVIRKSATVEAASMIPGIVRDGTMRLLRALGGIPQRQWGALKQRLTRPWGNGKSRVEAEGA
jgi:hypothetical protein